MTGERRSIAVVAENGNRCPFAPPQHASVQVRTLHRACLILGGIRQLAEHLKAPDTDVRLWLTDEAKMPDAIFHAAVEVLLLSAAGSGRAS